MRSSSEVIEPTKNTVDSVLRLKVLIIGSKTREDISNISVNHTSNIVGSSPTCASFSFQDSQAHYIITLTHAFEGPLQKPCKLQTCQSNSFQS